MLIEAKADINNCFDIENGNTVLMATAEEGQLETLELLLRANADVNGRNFWNETALELATQGHYDEVVDILQDFSNDNQRRRTRACSSRGSVNVLSLDSSKKLSEISSSLVLFSHAGLVPIVRLLISQLDESINSTTSGRETALHHACKNGHTEVAKMLMDSRADLNDRNFEKCQPLHLAVQNSHVSTIQLLLERRADVNAKATLQRTPLTLAVLTGNEVFIWLYIGLIIIVLYFGWSFFIMYDDILEKFYFVCFGYQRITILNNIVLLLYVFRLL